MADADELTAEFLDPVFYENENGPTIGVTLLGVLKLGDMYFRDLDNDQELDVFEDWRVDDETRANAFAAAMTDEQLIMQLVNVMSYSPINTATEKVLDENGKPVWTKIFNLSAGSSGSGTGKTGAEVVATWDKDGWRSYVLRSNPSTEVGVWFNNGLEQYAEFNAIQTGTVSVPYLSFTNPISHGLPGNEGMAAAALGDGTADLILRDSQLYRVSMWARGIDAIYGPQIDLVTDPRWSRNDGTYGEREDMAAEIAKAFTIGYQNGDQGLVEGGILLTLKHFPGDGAAFNGFESHGQTGRYRIYSTENSLANYQLKPFIAAFEVGLSGIMPGYSQPIIDERIAPQSITYNGVTYDIKLEGRGNSFNPAVLQYLVREVLGFKGLINSDSLNMNAQQGVEDLSEYERMVKFVTTGNQAGVIMLDKNDPQDLLFEALRRRDITREQLEAAAAGRALAQIMSTNMDNPYRDMEESLAAVAEVTPQIEALAEEAHLKSVVLMKNTENTLPLKDTTKKVYVAGFNQRGNQSVNGIKTELQNAGFTVVDDYNEADIAYLYVNPTIVGQGSSNLAILDLAEMVDTPVYDNNAKRTEDTATITTVSGMDDFAEIAEAVKANGGVVIGNINASNAWILSNMEPYCDALIGTFSTSDAAIVKVLTGEYNPTGKLPITMVADASVIALVETTLADGETWDICVSPNDVPGYVKDQYMSAEVLAASPSGSYAYKDANGNFYFSGHGLSYEVEAGEAGEANTELDYNSEVTALEGNWTLASVVVNGTVYAAVENALTFEIKLDVDPSELVDGPAYIHNQVYNPNGVLTFGVQSVVDALAADDVEYYKGSTSWEDFPKGEVVAEGGWYKQPGPATMRFKDIDDYGLFLKEIAGVEEDVDTTEKNLIMGLNAEGQLLLGYSTERLQNEGTEGEWVYVLVFTKA